MPELKIAHQRLVAWVRQGTEPPASSYPTLARGELVRPDAGAMGWPALSGWPSPDGKINRLPDQRFGSGMRYQIMSGVQLRQPPELGPDIAQLVPRVDRDGNETSGIRSVQLMVPLGTYLGWNVQVSGFFKGEGCGFAGGFIPFARSKAERLASHDPRLSLEERYGTHDAFVARVREAASQHRAAGWLADGDAARIVEQAAASGVLRK